MRKFICHALSVILPLHWVACGSDTPSFQEKPQALIKVAVNKSEDPNQISGESFDIDTLASDEESDTVGSADATAADSGSSTEANSVARSGSNREGSTAPGRGTSGRSPTEESVPVPGSTADAQGLPATDAKTVAKACAPALRNLGKALSVVSLHESNSTITIVPNSVIALKITGDRTKVVLDLDSQTPLLGLCFFLAGHETELQFTTASPVKAMAVVEAGDQASAQITLSAGSSETLSVDMRGHNPMLSIQGVSADLCEQARPRNAAASYSCQP